MSFGIFTPLKAPFQSKLLPRQAWRMRLKQLESCLSECVQPFESPKWALEQYVTPPHLAARMLHVAAESYGDIVDKAVLDLGCGTGMLSVASCLTGAGSVCGVDADPDALALASAALEEMEVDVEFVLADVLALPFAQGSFDTVVMNPPFGTKNKGVDVAFLEKALQMSQTAVYSMHKSSTRAFLEQKASSWGVDFEVIAQLKFALPATYKFHTKKSMDIEVDLIRLAKRPTA